MHKKEIDIQKTKNKQWESIALQSLRDSTSITEKELPHISTKQRDAFKKIEFEIDTGNFLACSAEILRALSYSPKSVFSDISLMYDIYKHCTLTWKLSSSPWSQTCYDHFADHYCKYFENAINRIRFHSSQDEYFPMREPIFREICFPSSDDAQSFLKRFKSKHIPQLGVAWASDLGHAFSHMYKSKSKESACITFKGYIDASAVDNIPTLVTSMHYVDEESEIRLRKNVLIELTHVCLYPQETHAFDFCAKIMDSTPNFEYIVRS